jgi:hypothetical protein
MHSRYESHMLTLTFQKEGITLGRPVNNISPPMIGDKLQILPGLYREVTEIKQEENGEYTLTEIELEPEKEGRIPSALLLLTNAFYPIEETWGVLQKSKTQTEGKKTKLKEEMSYDHSL